MHHLVFHAQAIAQLAIAQDVRLARQTLLSIQIILSVLPAMLLSVPIALPSITAKLAQATTLFPLTTLQMQRPAFVLPPLLSRITHVLAQQDKSSQEDRVFAQLLIVQTALVTELVPYVPVLTS